MYFSPCLSHKTKFYIGIITHQLNTRGDKDDTPSNDATWRNMDWSPAVQLTWLQEKCDCSLSRSGVFKDAAESADSIKTPLLLLRTKHCGVTFRDMIPPSDWPLIGPQELGAIQCSLNLHGFLLSHMHTHSLWLDSAHTTQLLIKKILCQRFMTVAMATYLIQLICSCRRNVWLKWLYGQQLHTYTTHRRWALFTPVLHVGNTF